MSAKWCRCLYKNQHNWTASCWYIKNVVVHFVAIIKSGTEVRVFFLVWPYAHDFVLSLSIKAHCVSPSNCGFAWLGFKWIFCMVSCSTAVRAVLYRSSSVISALWWKPPLCVTGRREDPEESQEENPKQAVCSGEPEEEEGVRWWTGKQVRWKGLNLSMRWADKQIIDSSAKICSCVAKVTCIQGNAATLSNSITDTLGKAEGA